MEKRDPADIVPPSHAEHMPRGSPRRRQRCKGPSRGRPSDKESIEDYRGNASSFLASGSDSGEGAVPGRSCRARKIGAGKSASRPNPVCAKGGGSTRDHGGGMVPIYKANRNSEVRNQMETRCAFAWIDCTSVRACRRSARNASQPHMATAYARSQTRNLSMRSGPMDHSIMGPTPPPTH